jgi:hypothetical protein
LDEELVRALQEDYENAPLSEQDRRMVYFVFDLL